MDVRPAAVAGTWYPGTRGALTREVDGYLSAVPTLPPFAVQAVIAPHAGIMFSGPVAAYAYTAAAAAGPYDVVALVGPSHFSAFEGVAVYPGRAFETPLGLSPIDAAGVTAMVASPVVNTLAAPHAREHSLEMQLPFLRRLLPEVPIVPMLMGFQRRETIIGLADALSSAFAGRRALLVASTDLSHFFDAATAASLDAQVQSRVAALDPEGLLGLIERYPEHDRGRFVACGAGPAIAVLLAARALGATEARILKYGHSGQISGDLTGVVGYLAAAIGKPVS
ncbi:MAG: AmmeMemoRadiSam system protein B [Vicinamibacterales bacterium]